MTHLLVSITTLLAAPVSVDRKSPANRQKKRNKPRAGGLDEQLDSHETQSRKRPMGTLNSDDGWCLFSFLFCLQLNAHC